jgi:hypothetical protein
MLAMSLADVAHAIQQPRSLELDECPKGVFRGDFEEIAESAAAALGSQGFNQQDIETEHYLDLNKQLADDP